MKSVIWKKKTSFQKNPILCSTMKELKMILVSNEFNNYFVSVGCCCCLPTPPCWFGGVLPYFEVTGHPVPVSSLGFKCPDCFI